MPKKFFQEEGVHEHLWGPSYDLASKKCSCGAIGVSEEECKRRTDEWINFYQMVKSTDSYQDFLKMREVFVAVASLRDRNEEEEGEEEKELDEKKQELRALSGRIEKRLAQNQYLPTPNFPDPGASGRYVII